MKKLFMYFVLLMLPVISFAGKTYNVCWSHYTGWEPYGYGSDKQIFQKWGKKYGININVTLVNDYVESINQYTSGRFSACAMTNMDALTIPAVGGVDSTALIVGDFSNGNDGIVIKNGKSMKDLKGRKVYLVELSVSDYLLSRALQLNNMSVKDMKMINTSDADIASVFTSTPKAAAVTWNPPLQVVRNVPGATMVFNSSQIPGEIIDMMVVKTDAPETLKKALTGAWYEIMHKMSAHDKQAKDAIAAMARQAGGTLAEFQSQLKTTAMFYKAKDASAFASSPKLKQTMEYVRTFCFNRGLFGRNVTNKDYVGIQMSDGSVLGDKNNIKLRFTDKYMKMAAEGKL